MDDSAASKSSFWLRWSRRAVMLALALLTVAIMAAILLPVYRGVSSDPRPRDAMGLPMGDRPHRAPPKAK